MHLKEPRLTCTSTDYRKKPKFTRVIWCAVMAETTRKDWNKLSPKVDQDYTKFIL